MIGWPDSNETFSPRFEQEMDTLCESSISRAATNPVGASARSEFLSFVARVFTPEVLALLTWCAIFAAGLVTGLWVAVLIGIARLP